MNFITRERIHVDRIATAWAIRRFVDAEATFEFVPRTRDVSDLPGIPFDVRGAELGHHRGRCTMEALLDRYEIRDPALRRMARIVRAADLPQEEPSPAVAPGEAAVDGRCCLLPAGRDEVVAGPYLAEAALQGDELLLGPQAHGVVVAGSGVVRRPPEERARIGPELR